MPETPPTPSFAAALRYWVQLGLLSFGGPAGQIAMMQHDLVDRRRWIGQAEFLRALNFCMVLPGPEAQQLATYIGWRLHGLRGATPNSSIDMDTSIHLSELVGLLAICGGPVAFGWLMRKLIRQSLVRRARLNA